jgi:hypothetical protein
MSESRHKDSEIAAVQAWFEARGLRLAMREDDGVFWADLISLATELVLAPRYGRGESTLGAAKRAQERFGQEQ